MSELDRHLSFFDGCVRTYSAATRMMTEVWLAEVGKPMVRLSGSPKARFKEALDHFVQAMKDDGGPSGLDQKLRDAAKGDAPLQSLIDDGLSAKGGLFHPTLTTCLRPFLSRRSGKKRSPASKALMRP